jgi:Bacterial Ig-like domain (group 3)
MTQGVFVRRFPALVFSVVTAAVTCGGLVAGAGPAIGATSAAASHRAATATAAGVTWGTAEEVPGTAALNTGGTAAVMSVSCASAGNCAAGGSYRDLSSHFQAFVVGETGGAWGTAEEVPGSAALNADGDAEVMSVSCASAGNCVAGGYYRDSPYHIQAFVVGETGGAWGTAREVPGSAALNTGHYAEVISVSCASAGNCVAGGFYTDSSSHIQAFVVGETGGTWGTAREVPGSAALNTGHFAEVISVSCASAGNCVAGGFYMDSPQSGTYHTQAFVVEETGGTWGTAREVPGSAALNAGGGAGVNSVSCASAGNCVAGGSYKDSSSHTQAFVVGETGGTWGTAQEVPGSAALNAGGSAGVNSVSCASAGNCAAGGSYTDSSSHQQVFVVGETGGAWGTAREVPGSAALNAGGSAGVNSVSCASAGNCAAGGFYTDGSRPFPHNQAFVVGETGGTWGTAQEVPGSAALNTGGSAAVYSVSCAPAGYCATGGYYLSAGGQAFVDETQAPRSPTSTSISLSAARVTYGHEQAEHVSVTVTSQHGTPGGKVTVKSGTATVCTITLASGKGSCTLTARQFAAGTQHLTASYGGSAAFAGSVSAAKTLTVAKASTKTTLSLSAATVTFGHEQSEHLTVTVTPQYSGTPGGKVTIKTGTITVCTITLASGKGSCTLTARQLSRGTHTLIAAYPASSDFTGSASAKKTLTVR